MGANEVREMETDIFSGCGNGTLLLIACQDPDNFHPDKDFNTKICINDGDLEDIYLHMFHLTEGKPYKEKDPIHWKLNGESKLLFPEFPMLNRIDFMYSDFIYNPEEVKKLREESIKIKSITSSEVSDLAFRKLIYACDKTLEVGLYLLLSCD